MCSLGANVKLAPQNCFLITFLPKVCKQKFEMCMHVQKMSNRMSYRKLIFSKVNFILYTERKILLEKI